MLLEVLLSFAVEVETLLHKGLIFRTELAQVGCLMVAVTLSVVHVMPSLLAIHWL